jgi:hypothetical protein
VAKIFLDIVADYYRRCRAGPSFERIHALASLLKVFDKLNPDLIGPSIAL